MTFVLKFLPVIGQDVLAISQVVSSDYTRAFSIAPHHFVANIVTRHISLPFKPVAKYTIYLEKLRLLLLTILAHIILSSNTRKALSPCSCQTNGVSEKCATIARNKVLLFYNFYTDVTKFSSLNFGHDQNFAKPSNRPPANQVQNLKKLALFSLLLLASFTPSQPRPPPQKKIMESCGREKSLYQFLEKYNKKINKFIDFFFL
jgi:hypothetical protein